VAQTAELAGDVEAAGSARLSLIEELADALDARALGSLYVAADEALARTQYAETVARLRRAARRVFEAQGRKDVEGVAVENVEVRAGGRAAFTPEAEAVIDRALIEAESRKAEIRRAVERASSEGEGTAFAADAVEVVLLRQKSSGAGDFDFARPWEGFSLKAETRRFERPFVELALRAAAGKVSHAAKLLGFAQANQLNSLLKTKHPDLLEARTPVVKRRRSIIGKGKARRNKSPS
jgi:hypothetical protein